MTRGNLIKEMERRQVWLNEFEEKLVGKYPQCRKSIQWEDANQLHSSGMSVEEALVKYEKTYFTRIQ